MATSGELSTAAEHLRAWQRLVATLPGDDALVERGEEADDVAYLSLTAGYRAAQLWLIDAGGGERWRKRSSAISSWSGTDAADGGRYVELADYCTDGAAPPDTDFLRLDSRRAPEPRSALVEAGGDQWGQEVSPEQDYAKGDGYYLKGEQLWLLRTASPPPTLYIRYFFRHPPITSTTTTFYMDVEARWLAVAEAAQHAVNEEWVPGGANVVAKVDRALARARQQCRSLVLRTGEPRRFRGVTVRASHW